MKIKCNYCRWHFQKKPIAACKYLIEKAAHAEEIRKFFVFSTPELKMVSPDLIASHQMPLKNNVSKYLAYYKPVSETLVHIEQKGETEPPDIAI